MRDRIDELALRRRELLLRSQQLRADLGESQRVVLAGLAGVERAYATAKRFAKPVLLAGAGVLLLRFVRRRRRPVPQLVKSTAGVLTWLGLARRLITLLPLIRAVIQARAARSL
ncbi:MAG: hypothetical protein IRZ28_11720 [Steroidobacteraceae bacterium]|nr:hypothetical protein [Steroidobacteraceae bacterium]